MPTYYALLKVPPTASKSEISAAIDEQYNQWRRLVTHHDRRIQNQANESLRLLEEIRGTLTNRARRAAYDAGIEEGGTTGGLADPAELLKALAPIRGGVSRGKKPGERAAQADVERVDAWICPKCKTANGIGTRFCKKCGNELGFECPKCQHLNEKTAGHCQDCGVNLRVAAAEAEEKKKTEQRRRKAEERKAKEEVAIQLALVPLEKRVSTAAKLSSLWWVLLGFGFYGIIWVISLLMAQNVLGNPVIQHDTELQGRARRIRNKSAFMAAIGLTMLCLLVANSTN